MDRLATGGDCLRVRLAHLRLGPRLTAVVQFREPIDGVIPVKCLQVLGPGDIYPHRL